MSQNLALFLPTCSIKFNPPHTEFSWAVRQRDWTPLPSSDQFFIYSLCCYVWLKTHTPLPPLNIIAQEGFNGPCFLLTSETTALTKWLDHLKQRMINVFPARHRGFDDLCHRRLRVELFFQCSGFLHIIIIFFISLLFFLASFVLLHMAGVWSSCRVHWHDYCASCDQWGMMMIGMWSPEHSDFSTPETIV